MNDKELIRAVNANNIEKVRELLPIVSDTVLNMIHESGSTHGGMAAIHVAALKGYTDILKLLIEDNRTDINIKTSRFKDNALQLAAGFAHFDACKLLLPFIEILNPDSKSAYFFSKQGIDREKNTEKVLNYKKINDLLRIPTFIRACQTGNLNIVKLMVEEGIVDINCKYGEDWGLKVACINRHIETVNYLLSLPHINLRMTTPNHDSLLHMMCSSPKQLNTSSLPLENCSFAEPSIRFLIIEKLISGGINVNARNSEGLTPLFFAVASNLLDAVKALIANGADLDLKYQDNESATLSQEEFNASKERIKNLLDNNHGLKEHFKPLLENDEEYGIQLIDCQQITPDFDIFFTAQNHPEILKYMTLAKKFGGGKLGEIRAANEELKSLLFKQKVIRPSLEHERTGLDEQVTLSQQVF